MFSDFSAPGGSMFGDVNISAILDSFSVSYDKRVRPNYGGKSSQYLLLTLNHHLFSQIFNFPQGKGLCDQRSSVTRDLLRVFVDSIFKRN